MLDLQRHEAMLLGESQTHQAEDVHCSTSVPQGTKSDKALGNIIRQCFLLHETRLSGRPGKAFHHEVLISARPGWKPSAQHYVTWADSSQQEKAIQVKDRVSSPMHESLVFFPVSLFKLYLFLPICMFSSSLEHTSRF